MEKHTTLPIIAVELHRYDIDPKTGRLIKKQKINLPKEKTDDSQ